MTAKGFKSIKGKGGLKVHLDETKSLHRGLGYRTFKILRGAGLNKTSMRKAFNVTFDTMKDWWSIDDKEQAEKKAEEGIDSLNGI